MADDIHDLIDQNCLSFKPFAAAEETKKVPFKFISFDDYHVLWRGIATSIVDYKKSDENDCEFDLSLYCYQRAVPN